MNHGEKRMTCPGYARPWFFSIGAKGQDMFTLNDVCTRWQLTEYEVVELVTTGEVYCQAHPFRADSFAFFVAEEEGKGSNPPEFDASFRLACDIDEKVEAWRKHSHPPLRFTQADILDAEARNPLLALAAQSCPSLPSFGTPQDQQPSEPAREFKTAKEFADHYRKIESVKAGWIMLELVKQKWGLKKYQAAALALGDPIPERGSSGARSYGYRFSYHTKKLLDESE